MLYFETRPHLVVNNRHHFLLGQGQEPHPINPGLGEVVDEIGTLIDLRIITKLRRLYILRDSVSVYLKEGSNILDSPGGGLKVMVSRSGCS